jgi:hypothetical protein
MKGKTGFQTRPKAKGKLEEVDLNKSKYPNHKTAKNASLGKENTLLSK